MLQDLRFAVRQLVRSRGFAVTAFVTLALGIGMTPAIFGVVDGVLFRSIPFPDAARLVMVWETDRDTGTSHEPGAWPDFIDFQRRATRIDRLAGIIAGETTLTPDRGDPVRLAGLVVTRELGIRLALGASPRSVARLVVGQGARLTVVGLAVGLVLAGPLLSCPLGVAIRRDGDRPLDVRDRRGGARRGRADRDVASGSTRDQSRSTGALSPARLTRGSRSRRERREH
jgi:hypothetical protein